jgi:hypothetical protein
MGCRLTHAATFFGSGNLSRAIYHSYDAKQSKKNLSRRIIFFILPTGAGQVKTASSTATLTLHYQ